MTAKHDTQMGSDKMQMVGCLPFFGSCKAQNINPYEWLKSTLERIPETKLSELETLLPGYKV